ncbi:hypothetical protein K458DRAFT_483143 [Lentithecium fluviatile CBS 122367]|uniref:Uncharacterized protein n=1 Tax=Lentithecium fluviatile CBS 122367 TaxID=1168545 RepID=A0A6G1JKT2_9PLEO|nr:hypothetical protein K458DRAFT_483143 [Lentithecium fluviatile CBS 122367]
MSTEPETKSRPLRKMNPIFRAGTAKQDSYSSTSATPVAAFALAVASALCIVGSALVIHLSHDRIVGAWIPKSPSVQPSVLLSIFASIFRTCQTLSLSYGVAILWWRTVLGGTTLKNLHYIWNKGQWSSPDGIRRAWASSPQTKRLMVTFCVISITNFVEGPLLQRSTKSDLLLKISGYEEAWSLPQDIPDGWSGSVDDTAHGRLFATADLSQVLQDWYSGKDIYVPDANQCNGTCTGEVVGPGITVNCSSARQYVDLTGLSNTAATAFDLTFNRTLDSENFAVMDMRLQFISTVDSLCNATVVIQSCTIRTAQVAYSVAITNNTVSLSYGEPLVVGNLTSVGDSVDTRDGLPAGTLAALDYFAYYYLQSNGTVGHNATENLYWNEPGHGTLSLEYQDYDPSHFDNNAQCAFQWVDATHDIVASLHEVIFRMAVAVSDGSLSLLWGFGELTREVTLSPLETGRALCEPCLSSRSMDDMEVEKIIEAMGDTPVRWDPQTRESEQESEVGGSGQNMLVDNQK